MDEMPGWKWANDDIVMAKEFLEWSMTITNRTFGNTGQQFVIFLRLNQTDVVTIGKVIP